MNETMARHYFPDGGAVGESIVLGGKETREIIGVVKDTYSIGLDAIEPLVYEHISGTYMPRLLVRSSPAEAVHAAAAIAKHLDPRIHVHAEPLTAQFQRHLSSARTASVLAATLGLLALILASVGMFGVFAFLVRQRTHEIGIRMVLGAEPARIFGLVLGASCRSVLTGFGTGILMSVVASRFIRSFLYGLSQFDAPAYGAVCLVLFAAAIAATWLPARRAMRIEPVQAPRYE